MDLDDLKPTIRVKDRHGYIYHTVFTRPTDGRTFHYIGQKWGQRINRRYFGSGVRLRQLVDKHGLKGNVKVFIVCWQPNTQLLNEAEIRLIKIARKLFGRDCINVADGGKSGFTGYHSAEMRRRLSEAQRGVFPTKETRAKRSKTIQALYASKQGIEIRKKIRAVHLGAKRSATTKRKMREKALARPKLTCPHCAQIGSGGSMHRWHFDNCREQNTTKR